MDYRSVPNGKAQWLRMQEENLDNLWLWIFMLIHNPQIKSILQIIVAVFGEDYLSSNQIQKIRSPFNDLWKLKKEIKGTKGAPIEKLPVSLKDDTARMNDSMKQKIRTEKVNIQTADPKASASIFLFFPTAHLKKNNFSQPHKWYIWFCPTHKPTLYKTKRAIFLLTPPDKH